MTTITSARGVGEFGDLMVDLPYTFLHRDKVSLQLHPKFIPQVSSEFHFNQMVHLPVFYLKLHHSIKETRRYPMDICRALFFYLHIMAPFQKSPWLFVTVAERMKGKPVSFQRLSRWISSSIFLCYDLMKGPPHQTHSTGAQVASAASLLQSPSWKYAEEPLEAPYASSRGIILWSKLWLQMPPSAQ